MLSTGFNFAISSLKDISFSGDLPGVFPVNIQSVELVISQEIDCFIDKLIHSEYIAGEFSEWR